MGLLIYDKPFKTLDEQIDFLKKEYNLIILDDNFAKKALSTLSYYDLINGYKECMMVSDKFKKNVSLEYLYAFHLFDKVFQNIIFKNSILVENLLKTKISYVIAKNLGVDFDEYLNPREYKNIYKGLNFYKLKEKFEKIYLFKDRKTNISKIKNTDFIPQPTRHYVENHNHIPPWILMRNASFENAINLYKLMKTTNKNETADFLIPNIHVKTETKIDFSIVSLSLIREFRNKIAHNLKFVTHTSDNYRLPKKATNIITKNKQIATSRTNLNDVYACIIAIMILLDSKGLRNAFFLDLYNCVKDADPSLLNDYLLISKLPNTFLNDIKKII